MAPTHPSPTAEAPAPPAAELAADEADPIAPALAHDDDAWRMSRHRRPVLDLDGYPLP